MRNLPFSPKTERIGNLWVVWTLLESQSYFAMQEESSSHDPSLRSNRPVLDRRLNDPVSFDD